MLQVRPVSSSTMLMLETYNISAQFTLEKKETVQNAEN